DLLVVAINSDESVRRLKGPTRPVVTAEDRAALLAGLEAVDYVTIFAEDDPVATLRACRPDVLVKGGDYTEARVVGAAEVGGGGGGGVGRARGAGPVRARQVDHQADRRAQPRARVACAGPRKLRAATPKRRAPRTRETLRPAPPADTSSPASATARDRTAAVPA